MKFVHKMFALFIMGIITAVHACESSFYRCSELMYQNDCAICKKVCADGSREFGDHYSKLGIFCEHAEKCLQAYHPCTAVATIESCTTCSKECAMAKSWDVYGHSFVFNSAAICKSKLSGACKA